MSGKTENPGSMNFFAGWLLLHEKADDWLKDALRRARESSPEARKDYQNFLLGVDAEKEHMKALFSEALVHELIHLGFVHKDSEGAKEGEIEELRERIRALEDQLARLKEKF